MVSIRSEKELQKTIIDNFPYYFDCEFVTSEYFLPNGKRIDILAKDEDVEYIIELKKDAADSSAVWQVFDYINVYKTIPGKENKKVFGIVAAPLIKTDAVQAAGRTGIVTTKELSDFVHNRGRSKFTTTLLPETIDKLGKLAPYYGGHANDVIEKIIEAEWSKPIWRERYKDEMDKKIRDNRVTS